MAKRNIIPTERIAECKSCGQSFTYQYTVGMARLHCSDRCRARHRSDLKAIREGSLSACSVQGCAGLATRISYGICELHYCRQRRTGRLERKEPGPRLDGNGYVSVKAIGHPLASGAWVRQHRLVAYDKHNGVCPSCYWCGTPTSWARCHVDHLNGVKADNRADNLVVACAPCNRARGAAWPFLTGLTPDGMAALVQAMREHKDIA